MGQQLNHERNNETLSKDKMFVSHELLPQTFTDSFFNLNTSALIQTSLFRKGIKHPYSS